MRPRMFCGAASMVMALCMVEKPDWPSPPTASRQKARTYHGDQTNMMAVTVIPIDPSDKNAAVVHDLPSHGHESCSRELAESICRHQQANQRRAYVQVVTADGRNELLDWENQGVHYNCDIEHPGQRRAGHCIPDGYAQALKHRFTLQGLDYGRHPEPGNYAQVHQMHHDDEDIGARKSHGVQKDAPPVSDLPFCPRYG